MSQTRTGNPFLAENVIVACNRKIHEIETVRYGRMEGLYRKYQFYRKYWLFGPMLERTRSEALRCAQDWAEIDHFHAENYGYESHEIVSAIRRVAEKVHGNLVYLTREEFNLIAGHYTA